ncbi:MAG: CDP-alcohol phosphatidyltransferase family protein [Oscillospiraceae bacterium]|nr:CDP-alcohol phosphatidyltransferase family protein [Oscillospiraceae bacterium]
MKLRYLPNAFSIARLLLCIPLLILSWYIPFTLFYTVLFAIAAITDMFDGQLARRIKGAKSELGATLDSVADLALISVLIFALMPLMRMWSWLSIAFICVLTLKLFASTCIGFIRFKEFISLHTISFKILATLLFIHPLVYYFAGPGMFLNIQSGAFFNFFSTAIAAYALICVIEEIFIVSLTKRPERNLKSIFGVKAANIIAETTED